MEYLGSIMALVSMIELFIILRLSSKTRRLNAENDLLIRTIEIQTNLIEKITSRVKADK